MTHTPRALAALLLLIVIAAGCSASGSDTGSEASSVAATADALGSPEAGSRASDAGTAMTEDAGVGTGSAGGSLDSAAMSSGAVAAPAAGSVAADDVRAVPPLPPPGDTVPVQSSPLRAGSVDDNEAFEDFLTYLDRVRSLGVQLRPMDATGRILLTVTGQDGRPVAGVQVTADDGAGVVAQLRTTADGTARFLPGLMSSGPGNDQQAPQGQQVVAARSWTFTAEGVSAAAEPGGAVSLVLGRDGGADGSVPVDVMFLLDATGSMSDEIDQLKATIADVADRIASLEGSPDVRFGLTTYRDEGDLFVTRARGFRAELAEFQAELSAVVADGGGDYPEAVDEGIAEALAAADWRDPATTVQLVFLVGDAPPHVERQVEVAYPDSVRTAVSRGIKIFPIASSESDDTAEAVFRQLAQATGARFVFLSYGAGGAATGGNTDITTTDYEELALGDLVVRLVAEELAALTGEDTVPQITPITPTPGGQ